MLQAVLIFLMKFPWLLKPPSSSSCCFSCKEKFIVNWWFSQKLDKNIFQLKEHEGSSQYNHSRKKCRVFLPISIYYSHWNMSMVAWEWWFKMCHKRSIHNPPSVNLRLHSYFKITNFFRSRNQVSALLVCYIVKTFISTQ